MAEKEKKILYGGSYDDAINETYQQIQNRPAFNYDVNGDALYQQYKDRYTQNAKQAMKDTMGQTAALTGGYGNSYGHAVGQQRYDETMRGLTDMIPQLEQQAYQRYQDQGNALNDRLGMLHNLGAAEQATRQGNYQNIANLIASTGYQPSEQELAAAGMSPEQANAMVQMWITSNPDAAYANGRLSPEDYYKLTGRYPIGYTPPGTGGGYGGYYGNGTGADESGVGGFKSVEEAVRALAAAGASAEDIQAFANAEGGGATVSRMLGKDSLLNRKGTVIKPRNTHNTRKTR